MMALPFVSVLVPTHNNAMVVKKCLTSLFSQNYPRDKIEIILVADTFNDVPKLDRYSPKVILANLKPGAKRNLAVKEAKGEIIAFCDDDVVAHHNWIREIVSDFTNSDVAVVGGPNLTPTDATLKERCSGYIFSSFFGSGSMATRYRSKVSTRDADERELISCNMAVRKSVLREIPFPEWLWPNEENVFCHLVKKNGYRLIYEPDAIVWHQRHPVFVPHAKQVFGYGSGRGKMIKRYPSSTRMIHLLPSAFVAFLLIGGLLSLLNGLIRPLFITMLFTYLMIASLASANIAVRNRDSRAFLLLPGAFLLHHTSYGIGLLKGVLSRERNPDEAHEKETS